tara:strand:+ start:940 stop:1596 length:657 start_codon:yes stop_codon:yes gene_type:complete
MGSAHCNPHLHSFLDEHGFGAFQFNKWDAELMKRLEQQQLDLIEEGRERHVLILVDDITMDYTDREQLAHLCIRGRHFHVSVMMLSVSYSNFHKSCRRSADIICLFSLGCQTDKELMTKEFAHQQHRCEFYMRQICEKEYTCAVLNLNEKKQTVYWYQAPGNTTAPPCIEGRERSGRESGTAETLDDGDSTGPENPVPPPTRTDSPEDEQETALILEC